MTECIHRRGGATLDKNEFAGLKEPVMGVTVIVKDPEPSKMQLCVILARALAGEPVPPYLFTS